MKLKKVSFLAGLTDDSDEITPLHQKDIVTFGVDDNISQQRFDLVNLHMKTGGECIDLSLHGVASKTFI